MGQYQNNWESIFGKDRFTSSLNSEILQDKLKTFSKGLNPLVGLPSTKTEIINRLRKNAEERIYKRSIIPPSVSRLIKDTDRFLGKSIYSSPITGQEGISRRAPLFNSQVNRSPSISPSISITPSTGGGYSTITKDVNLVGSSLPIQKPDFSIIQPQNNIILASQGQKPYKGLFHSSNISTYRPNAKIESTGPVSRSSDYLYSAKGERIVSDRTSLSSVSNVDKIVGSQLAEQRSFNNFNSFIENYTKDDSGFGRIMDDYLNKPYRERSIMEILGRGGSPLKTGSSLLGLTGKGVILPFQAVAGVGSVVNNGLLGVGKLFGKGLLGTKLGRIGLATLGGGIYGGVSGESINDTETAKNTMVGGIAGLGAMAGITGAGMAFKHGIGLGGKFKGIENMFTNIGKSIVKRPKLSLGLLGAGLYGIHALREATRETTDNYQYQSNPQTIMARERLEASTIGLVQGLSRRLH